MGVDYSSLNLMLVMSMK